jgi:hypothetical protein
MENRVSQIRSCGFWDWHDAGRPQGDKRHKGWGYPRRAAVAATALALSACAPHPRTALIYCLTPPQLEKLKAAEPPLIGDKLTGQAQDDFKLVAGSDIMLRQFSHDLVHVLENCTEAPGK